MHLEAALAFFLPNNQLSKIFQLRALTSGNINATWLLQSPDGADLVLQRLNSFVFPDPAAIMGNFRLISAHLVASQQTSPSKHIFLRPLANPQGEDCFLDPAGDLWRLCQAITPSRTLHKIENATQARALGQALADFHLRLNTLNQAALVDPLPGFHDTPSYLAAFEAQDHTQHLSQHEEETCVNCIVRHRSLALLAQTHWNDLAVQVVHADPKLGNFLFAPHADQVLSLIDLDTTRAGLLLHDLGDCLRSACNPCGEEEQRAFFDPDIFEAILQAYLGHAGGLLTKMDKSLLISAAQILAFELGLRFFTDHLNGDRYFSVRFRGHNLRRAQTQFRLLESIIKQQAHLEARLRRLIG